MARPIEAWQSNDGLIHMSKSAAEERDAIYGLENVRDEALEFLEDNLGMVSGVLLSHEDPKLIIDLLFTKFNFVRKDV